MWARDRVLKYLLIFMQSVSCKINYLKKEFFLLSYIVPTRVQVFPRLFTDVGEGLDMSM